MVKYLPAMWENLGLDPWVQEIPWRKEWQHIPVFLPGESHGQSSLAGYSPWDHKVTHSLDLRLTKYGNFQFKNFPAFSFSVCTVNSLRPYLFMSYLLC